MKTNLYITWALCLMFVASSTAAKDTNLADALEFQVASNLVKVADWDEIKIVSNLEQALLPPSQNVPLAVALLKFIRGQHLVKARSQLEKILVQVNALKAEPTIRSFDPAALLATEINKTLLSLELDSLHLDGLPERANYLLKSIETKIAQANTNTYGNELGLLQEQSTDLTPKMLNLLDSNSQNKIKEVALLVLKRSKSSQLESQILARVAKYQKDDFLYPRLLGLLSEVGGENSIEYLLTVVEKRPNESITTMSKVALKKLSARVSDPAITNRINRALNGASPKHN